jgi:cysteine synthase A
MVLARTINNNTNNLQLNNFFNVSEVYLKLEGYNEAGSIKFKTATYLIQDLEHKGEVIKGVSTVIESSSGNLGVALAIVCQKKGYNFLCVMDENATSDSISLIKKHGGKVLIVNNIDKSKSNLQARIEMVDRLLRENPTYVWTNQYGNYANVLAHKETTGPEIVNQFGTVDYIFIGTSTTGTLSGCSQYLQAHSPQTKIIAVEPSGSVTFGGKPSDRKLPGLGTGVRPQIADYCYYDKVIYVSEPETIRMCHHIKKRYSILIGCSTGTVLCAVKQYFQEVDTFEKGQKVVVISPDNGEKYQNTVYNREWVFHNYGIDINE